MKIGVIGLGIVGREVERLFASYATVIGYDSAGDDPYPYDDLASCDFSVVCVGTPPAEDGSCDTSNVFDAVKRVPTQRIMIKSTVPPGTTDRLRELTGKQICFCPEYVGEGAHSAPQGGDGADFFPFVIIGSDRETRRGFIDDLVPIAGPAKTFFQCSALEAEVIKYMENAYLATKVTFVNEFFEICKVFGADWHTVREGWLLDPRIGRAHSAVFPGRRGFDGRCLPKDVSAVVHATRLQGYTPELLVEVLASNERFRAPKAEEGDASPS